MEIVFSVTQEADGGYVAECLSHDIFTQGDTWEQVRANVQEAVAGYFFDQRTRLVRSCCNRASSWAGSLSLGR